MRQRGLASDTSGASSATGNVLLVAVVIVFLGSAALFVGDLASVGNSTPQATFAVEYDADSGVVSFSHQGGDRFTTDNTEQLRVEVVDADTGNTTTFDWIGENGSATAVSTGAAFDVDDANGQAVGNATLANATFEAGDEVRLVWEGPEKSVVVREFTVGSDARSYLAWTLDPTDDLSRRYEFEDAESEVAADQGDTGSAEDASIQGATTGVSGQVGTAYEFEDTRSEYLAVPRSYDTQGTLSTMSACAWFNTGANPSGDFDNWALLDFDRSEYFNLFVYGNGDVGFSTTDNTSSTHDLRASGSYNDGSWHQACGVYNGTHKIIYVDGTQEAVANPYGGNPLGTGTTRYGFVGDGSEASTFDGSRNGLHYDGRIDEVRLYNRSLSSGEVSDLYTADTGGNANRPTGSLVLYYPLDENYDGDTLTASDDSPAGDTTDAAVNGPNTGVSGQVGTAYEFDGAQTDYLASEQRYDTQGALPTVSACAWFNTDESTGTFDNWALLDFDRSEYFNLFVYGNGSVGFATTDQSGTIHDMATPGTYNDGSWHHACAVYDGTEKKIYVNGTLVKSANPYGGNALGTGTTRYGVVGDGSEMGSFDGSRNGFGFTGRIDEVRLYNRSLSASEVSDLYSADTGGNANRPTSDLVTYYPLDEDFGEADLQVSDTGEDPAQDGKPADPDRTVTGQIGTGAEFDGSDYVALQDPYDSQGALSAVSTCAWFRTSESAGDFDNWALLDFDRSEYFNLFVYGNGSVGFATTNAGGTIHDLATSNSSYNDGSWHQACGVYNGTHKIIYVDGTQEAVANPYAGDPLGTGTTRYGVIGDGSEMASFDGSRNENYYVGRIDEVRLYERALSADAVERLYLATGGSTGDTTFETAVREYPEPLAADSLSLENVDASLPSGTTVEVTVLSDPDGDGTFEETSDNVTLDGSGGPYDVTGLTTDSDRFKLEVTLKTSGGTSPTFRSGELVEDDG